MCGRVRLSSDVSEGKLVFSAPFSTSPNVAPIDPLPIVQYYLKAGERSVLGEGLPISLDQESGRPHPRHPWAERRRSRFDLDCSTSKSLTETASFHSLAKQRRSIRPWNLLLPRSQSPPAED